MVKSLFKKNTISHNSEKRGRAPEMISKKSQGIMGNLDGHSGQIDILIEKDISIFEVRAYF